MSAFRRAVLSVAPERLEQFTNEMKKNISEKDVRTHRRKQENSSSSAGRSKRRKKSSSRDRDSKKSGRTSESSKKRNIKRSEDRKKKASSRSNSKERKHSHKQSDSKKTSGEKHRKSKDDSDYDPRDLDLTIPLPTLSGMVKDRKVLLDTAFSIIKGPKLTSMLPDTLKLTPLEEIKQLCGEQLNVMSSKRLLHILTGMEMESSSGTDSSDDEKSKPESKMDLEEPTTIEPVHDHSLQANLIDSTTTDAGPSMLFPSALTTARSVTKSANMLARKIDNDKQEEDDNVSTSTEPNLIYSKEFQDRSPADSSDTEEGEVLSSADQSEDEESEESEKSQEGEATPEHPNEELLVEVEEEIEEVQEEEHHRGDSAGIKILPGQTSSKDPPGTDVEKTKIHKTSTPHDKPENKVSTETSARPALSTVHQKSDDNISNQPSDDYTGKSQLEILELELRARAIRSLMKAAKAGKLKPANVQ